MDGVMMTWEGISFAIFCSRPIRYGKLKSGKEQGPSGLTGIESLCIFLCIRDFCDRVLVEIGVCPLKPVSPFLQGFLNRYQFLVADVIVGLCSGRFSWIKCAWIQLLGLTMAFWEDCPDSVAGSIHLHYEWCTGVGVFEYLGCHEASLEFLECSFGGFTVHCSFLGLPRSRFVRRRPLSYNSVWTSIRSWQTQESIVNPWLWQVTANLSKPELYWSPFWHHPGRCCSLGTWYRFYGIHIFPAFMYRWSHSNQESTVHKWQIRSLRFAE